MSSLWLFICTSLIWGSTWIVITAQLGSIPPEVSVMYRFWLAVILAFLWLFYKRARLRFPFRQHLIFALGGITLFSANYILIYYSESYINSGLVAITFTLLIFLNILGKRFIFKEMISNRVKLGGLMGGLGVIAIFSNEIFQIEHHDKLVLGFILGVLSTCSASMGNLIAYRNSKAHIPVISGNAWGMFYGAIATTVFCYFSNNTLVYSFDSKYFFALFYLSLFGTVIAFQAYITLLGRIGPEKASYTSVITPVIAVLLSVFFEKFNFNLLTLLGVALCLGGNLLVLKKARPDGAS